MTSPSSAPTATITGTCSGGRKNSMGTKASSLGTPIVGPTSNSTVVATA